MFGVIVWMSEPCLTFMNFASSLRIIGSVEVCWVGSDRVDSTKVMIRKNVRMRTIGYKEFFVIGMFLLLR